MFKNTAIPYTPDPKRFDSPASYGFKNTSKLLFVWSRLFQSIVSQAGTYLLTGKFHDKQCSIYKCEGGCAIPGEGDLVLTSRACYFDCFSNKKSEQKAVHISKLITHIVLGWDPNDPINSMLKLASNYIKVTPEELNEAVKISSNGGVFGGNSLSAFFSWNPFSEAPIDREYERFCLIKISGKSEKEIDQKHADEDLGKEFLEKLIVKIKAAMPNSYLIPMCCSPNREGKKVSFWINTGRDTQIDGWKTQKDIEDFLKSDGILKNVERDI